MRLAVLASGRGSNLQAILDAIGDGVLDASVVGVFSDRPKAQALERARGAGIPAIALRPADFDTREAFDTALFDAIAAVQPDLVVCAGYMRLLGAAQVAAWHGRMINIHPSLLPLFKGLRTHEQALAAGALEHGASVHFVTAELDGGPVIAQARVAVVPGDDATSLALRVLDREHPLLLATLQLLVARRLRLDGASVEFDGRPLRQPLQLAGMDLVEIE
ncbi:MAG TPA: phosphoribosylglycinamide formyltransferase [Lysobacter sp.]